MLDLLPPLDKDRLHELTTPVVRYSYWTRIDCTISANFIGSTASKMLCELPIVFWGSDDNEIEPTLYIRHVKLENEWTVSKHQPPSMILLFWVSRQHSRITIRVGCRITCQLRSKQNECPASCPAVSCKVKGILVCKCDVHDAGVGSGNSSCRARHIVIWKVPLDMVERENWLSRLRDKGGRGVGGGVCSTWDTRAMRQEKNSQLQVGCACMYLEEVCAYHVHSRV